MRKIFFFMFIILQLSSCDDFVDVNSSPNNPQEVNSQSLLIVGEVGAAFANANELNRFALTTMQYNAGLAGNPLAYDRYGFVQSTFDNQWNFELYQGALITLEDLIRVGAREESYAYVGIAKILKAYTFAMVTDIWGDVPYSQALKGTTYPMPRLDTQQDIYKGNATLGIQSLFDLVREGISDLDKPSKKMPASDDRIYNGNISNWKRFANTLLLKLAIQISEVEPVLARSVINEVITGNNYITENAQDGNLRFSKETGAQSPVHQWTNVSLFQNEMMMSSRFLDRLVALNDPRLDKFFTKPSGTFVARDNGSAATAPAVAVRSKLNSYVTGDGEGPVRLITNFQRAFILAEAALVLGTPGSAQDLHQEGIRASMRLAGLTDADIDAYFANNPTVVQLSGSIDQQREQILTQKYIAWTGNGLEAWNDWRRTGYPRLNVSQNAGGIDGQIPVRLGYSPTELARNANFPNPGPQPNERLWWDVN
jgi:hypothetical protein